MAHYIELEAVRTYATKANAIKAVEKKIGPNDMSDQTYFIAITEEGRYYPIFIGQRAIQAQLHFHFNVVG
ncbi:hypothetical protein [uncultured Deefgea sp.]|uniref:hypothetical protein n=1 Tax=uncultured Deefgea sp. TaxID=1304914 RepID=UPI002614A0D6|nr:hypothetical protein [uncultured Deefgea sp.]